MPVLTHVEFRGRKAISLKEIEENTGLKVGNRADPTQDPAGRRQIQRLYQEKGYELAEVKLVEGGNVGDTKVVFEIFEGPKFKIASIDFKGNVFATDAQLWTKISSRKPILGLVGGKYHRDMLEEDARKLTRVLPGPGLLRGQGHAGHPPGDEPGRRRPDLRDLRGDAVQGPQPDLRGEQEDQDRRSSARAWSCTRASRSWTPCARPT